MSSYSHRNAILARMGFPDYGAYLESDLWRSIRQQVLDAAGGACCACHRKAVQVHHGSYTEVNLRGIALEHLFAVCCGCHRGIEFRGKRKILDMAVVQERLRQRMASKGQSGTQKPSGIERHLRQNVEVTRRNYEQARQAGKSGFSQQRKLKRAELALDRHLVAMRVQPVATD